MTCSQCETWVFQECWWGQSPEKFLIFKSNIWNQKKQFEIQTSDVLHNGNVSKNIVEL